MYCSKCGTENPNDALFCHACGESTNAVPPIVTPIQEKDVNTHSKETAQLLGTKTKNSAGVLALLLGGIGIHKFYLGSWCWGLVYMLFFMTWIPFIMSLIEAIYFFTMNENDFDQKYNSRPIGPFGW